MPISLRAPGDFDHLITLYQYMRIIFGKCKVFDGSPAGWRDCSTIEGDFFTEHENGLTI
jgi:hypothetical protein